MKQNTKKKKYWLIPVCIFILLVISLFIVVYPMIIDSEKFSEVAFSPLRIISIFIVGACSLGLIPSIAIAIYLSKKEK